MKRSLIMILLVLSIFAIVKSQSPQAFNYEAIIRDNSGNVLNNRNIYIVIRILEGSTNGSTVFEENHFVSTDQFGFIQIAIGSGNNVTGSIGDISWGTNDYYIQTSIDINGTSSPVIMGVSQILTVPYALYADRAGNVDDDDADPANEIQDISLSGSNLSISGGSTVDLSVLQDGNEPNTDNQVLSISGNELSIENGNSVLLPAGGSDADADSLNEIQDISLSGSDLSISKGSTVDLSVLQDGYEANTDEQTLSISGNQLSITNGNTINLPEIMDKDSTNELISYGTLIGTTLRIYEADDSVDIDLSDVDNDINLSIILSQGNDAGNQRIINISDPVSDQDAVSKKYVDSLHNTLYTEMILDKGEFTDLRDFHTYPIVTIGSLIWMGENLDYAHDSSWYYDNDPGNDTLGRLYNYYGAMNACPDGWRLPSDEDWWDLEIALGMNPVYAHTDSLEWRNTAGVGTALKEGGSSGFEAKYGGSRLPGDLYHQIGQYARFWCSSEYDEAEGFRRALYIGSTQINRERFDKRTGYSVRCVKE